MYLYVIYIFLSIIHKFDNIIELYFLKVLSCSVILVLGGVEEKIKMESWIYCKNPISNQT